MIKIKFKGNFEKDIEKEIAKQKEIKIKSLVNNLKLATPVDTGNARDHWEYSNGFLKNPVEYISNLNQGTSSQAPAYFIEKTLLSQPGVKPNGTVVRSL